MEMTMIKVPKQLKDKLKLRAAENQEPMYELIRRMLKEYENNTDKRWWLAFIKETFNRER